MNQSPRRRRTFRILFALLPVAALGLGELGARLTGLGGYPPVILDVGDDGKGHWYATHRPGTDSFFYTRRSLTGGMRELHFTTPKGPNTVRVVLLGESAMQGFPQPLPLTNGAFLEAMLNDVWSQPADSPAASTPLTTHPSPLTSRRVEVLNFGATAVASFPVMCFLNEVLAHDPDLVVVMCGSNEFYGAYGVASLHSAGRSPLGMRAMRRLRGLGLTQWLSARVQDETLPSGKLMELVAAEQQIPRDDPLRAAATNTLRTHLGAMVRRCAAHKIPVVVCTIPTNERGLAPIGLDVGLALPPEQRDAFHRNLTAAENQLRTDPAQAAGLARTALDLDGQPARAHFVLASALTALERHEEALAEYIRARDLDTMPWRATSLAGQAVREAAGEGALLCDMEAAFRAQSPGGAIGWELMDDHVHFSLAGQALFARTIAGALTSLDGPLHVNPAALDRLPAWPVYAERLRRSVYTDYVAASRIRALFDISFMKRSNAEAFARFETLSRTLLADMSDVDRKAVERWRDPGLHGATDRPLTFVVGIYRMLDGDHAAAAPLFEAARADVPAVSLWRLQLTWYLLQCRRQLLTQPAAEDLQLCREAIDIGELLNRFGGSGKPEVQRYLGLAHHLAGNHARAMTCLEQAVRSVSGREGWEVVEALADSYLQLGQVAAARRLLELAIQDSGMRDAARRMLAGLGTRDE